MDQKNSRRSFLRQASLTTAALGTAPYLLSASTNKVQLLHREYSFDQYGSNDHINIALIGSGIQGIYDTQAALMVDGVKIVAACDLYTGRLDRA
ncbi:MAG TPA: oxidoreductase, partial [Maribacter sp.]|nr:oxidoreductase [Maribacter sp.]